MSLSKVMPENVLADSFGQLMTAAVAGDNGAAARIVEEYTGALVRVAQRQIGRKLGRRVDPEDVVQSAYRSFFVRMGRGEYDIGDGRELWKLLVTITLNKIRRQAEFHGAQKRDVKQEVSAAGTIGAIDRAGSPGPGPEEAAALVDEVDAFLGKLRESDRDIVELRLRGLTSLEIAEQLGRSERVVRRIITRVMERLTQVG